MLILLAILVGIALVAVGRGGALRDDHPDRVDTRIPPPGQPVLPEAVDAIRFGLAFRGYRMDEVDDALDRLRDEIALLRGQLQARGEYGAGSGRPSMSAPSPSVAAATGLDGEDIAPVAASALIAESHGSPAAVEDEDEEPVFAAAAEPHDAPEVDEPVLASADSPEPLVDEQPEEQDQPSVLMADVPAPAANPVAPAEPDEEALLWGAPAANVVPSAPDLDEATPPALPPEPEPEPEPVPVLPEPVATWPPEPPVPAAPPVSQIPELPAQPAVTADPWARWSTEQTPVDPVAAADLEAEPHDPPTQPADGPPAPPAPPASGYFTPQDDERPAGG